MKKRNCGGNISQVGFTLIELLVVVLVIGILAAIALPQYQKAVLKSRFSSLMPTTKAIRDGNEIYYMTNNRYAHTIADLDVTTIDTQDMTLEISDDADYTYIFATRPDLNEKNNLIMYQKHSAQFPGEIHCEAKQDDSQADWLCRSALHAVKELGEVITPGYNTFVIEGTGNGFTPAQLDAMNGPNCDKALEMGYTCTMTENEDGTKTKLACNSHGMCSIYDYNEDGSYKRTTCQMNANNVCDSKVERMYDENGKLVSEYTCATVDDATGKCASYSYGIYYTYDENGNKISARGCTSIDASTGKCATYSTYDNKDYIYDQNGNLIAERACNGIDPVTGKCTSYAPHSSNYDYTYDENGNRLSQRYCYGVNVQTGACTGYSLIGQSYDYTYDENGQPLSRGYCQASENHTSYPRYSSSCGNYSRTDFTYDSNGNVVSERICEVVSSSGSCLKYATWGEYNYAYDKDGNQTSKYICEVDGTGNCTSYTGGYDYTYDDRGNQTSEKRCSSVGKDGNCNSYSEGTYYTYDDNGNKTAELSCSSIASDGSCSAYSGGTYYSYDANGNQTSERSCQSVGSSGACDSYGWEGWYTAYDENGNVLWNGLCEEFGEDGDCSKLAAKGGYQ